MRDHQTTGASREDVLAWSGTLLLGLVGIGLVAIWLVGRAQPPTVAHDALDDILPGVVAVGGLLCLLAVGVGAAALVERPLSARSHAVRRDPSRHGAYARSTVSASITAPPRAIAAGVATPAVAPATAAESPLPPVRRARHL